MIPPLKLQYYNLVSIQVSFTAIHLSALQSPAASATG